MKNKSLYLKGCRTGYEKYWTFMELDDVIKCLKNERIYDFWKRNFIKKPNNKPIYNYENIVDYNEFKNNYRIFAKQDINELYKLFCLLISISLDGDIDECMNSLEAIERIKNDSK